MSGLYKDDNPKRVTKETNYRPAWRVKEILGMGWDSE
jgi:hypothetical protein